MAAGSTQDTAIIADLESNTMEEVSPFMVN
jgi:hypothetical protein